MNMFQHSISKNLLLFSAGKLISVFGSSIYTFAMGMYVLELTGSGTDFALVLALGTIPMVLANPFAGVAADRLDKKVLVVVMDLISGVMLAGVYLLSHFYGLSIPLIYITTFLLTLFATFFGVAMEAAKPNIVAKDMLLNINSVSKIIDSLSAILGPAAGGIIFALIDIRLFTAINGVTFIFSAILEMFIDFRPDSGAVAVSESGSRINLLKDIKEGFGYLLERKELKSLYAILVTVNFAIGFSINVPLPFIIIDVLKMTPGELGIIQGMIPAGMIAGALFVGRVYKRASYLKLFIRLNNVMALCMLLIALPAMPFLSGYSGAARLFYYCTVMMIFGAVISFIDIPFAYSIQSIIPEEYRGRVLSIGISIIKAILPAALILSGWLLNVMPAHFMPKLGGVSLLLLNIYIGSVIKPVKSYNTK